MDNDNQNVVITNIKMPFFSMVIFMLKWVLASIPALILIGFISILVYLGFDILGLNLSDMSKMLKDMMP